MASRYLSPKQISRIEALRQKHSILSTEIENSYKKVSVSDFYITQLKKQKLLVKQELQSMSRVAANAA